MLLRTPRRDDLGKPLLLARQSDGVAARRQLHGRHRPDQGSAKRARAARAGESPGGRATGGPLERRRPRDRGKPAGAGGAATPQVALIPADPTEELAAAQLLLDV